MAEEKKTFTTYIEVANKLIEENPDFYTQESKDGVLSFAKYLDSFKTITTEMQLLVLQKSREIDRDVILNLFNEVGKERGEEIIRAVYEKHNPKK